MPSTTSSTVFVKQTVDLIRIFDDDINCCVLQRAPSTELSWFVYKLNLSINVQKIIDCQEPLLPQIHASLPSELLQLSASQYFVEELYTTLEMYSLLLGPQQMGMRLVTLNYAMCPGFHIDKVGVRLVCTYRGATTEWLENADVDRSKLGLIAKGVSDEASGIIQHSSAIHSMTPYDIGLLKGEAWLKQDGTSNCGNGIVHRSPQVQINDGLRLLLTLDAFG